MSSWIINYFSIVFVVGFIWLRFSFIQQNANWGCLVTVVGSGRTKGRIFVKFAKHHMESPQQAPSTILVWGHPPCYSWLFPFQACFHRTWERTLSHLSALNMTASFKSPLFVSVMILTASNGLRQRELHKQTSSSATDTKVVSRRVNRGDVHRPLSYYYYYYYF